MMRATAQGTNKHFDRVSDHTDRTAIWCLTLIRAMCLVLTLCAGQIALGKGEETPTLGEVAGEEGTWGVNMKGADIRAFIGQVSDITKLSFVVDPRVKGKVTVVAKKRMTADEVYALFNSVLNVHGFVAVPSGNVVKIVPNQTAKQDSIPLRQGRNLDGEELVTRVIPIVNTPAIELVPILRPLIPQYGHLAGVASANSLIISDHASNIQRILDIIKRLDTAESEELEVIQLREAWVGDVVDLLQNLEPVESGKKSTRASRSSSTAQVTVVAEERTNRLIVKGEKSARARIRALVIELDQPSKFSGATKVVYLRHADAAKVAEILKNMETERQGGGGRSSKGSNQAVEKTNIQADETLNALVIRAQPTEMTWMEDVVRQLDIRRAQVLIEAAIVEVSGDVSNALGIQWASLNKDGGPVGGISFSNLGSNLNGVISALTGDNESASLADGVTLAGGERNSAGESGYGALLQAIASSSNANLLSTPSIMTLDNEEAEIIVGQNVPFITGSTTNTNSGTTNPFQTISREDVGLTLKVIPQINDGDVVRLQVEQEVSSVVPSSEAIQSADLITNKRSIKTTILADNGETLVLGGLIQDDFTDSEQKVPVLGDIPLLGRLFKSKSRVNVKRNLLVFLQPRIIRETTQARAATDEKYERVRTLQLEIDSSGSFTNWFKRDKRRLPEDEGDLLEGMRVKK